MAEFQHQRAEETYYRRAREAPLGRGYTAGGLVLPPHAAGPQHAFGIPSVPGDAAKDLISPVPPSVEETEREALYERSHHAYCPGVQRTQALDWAATRVGGPTAGTFGKPTRTEPGAVAAVLGRGSQAARGSVLVPKAVQDHHDSCDDPLGATRGRSIAAAAAATGLMSSTAASPLRTYGAPSGGSTRPGARKPEGTRVADCLRGAEGQDADAMQAREGKGGG